MQISYPLPDTNPEFTLRECPNWREYRVENWRLARDGSGRIIRGVHGWSWREALLAAFVAYLWPKVCSLLKDLRGRSLVPGAP